MHAIFRGDFQSRHDNIVKKLDLTWHDGSSTALRLKTSPQSKKDPIFGANAIIPRRKVNCHLFSYFSVTYFLSPIFGGFGGFVASATLVGGRWVIATRLGNA